MVLLQVQVYCSRPSSLEMETRKPIFIAFPLTIFAMASDGQQRGNQLPWGNETRTRIDDSANSVAVVIFWKIQHGRAPPSRLSPLSPPGKCYFTSLELIHFIIFRSLRPVTSTGWLLSALYSLLKVFRPAFVFGPPLLGELGRW